MTDRELLYVKVVADEQSISKAAEKLFLSQPSLSKSIQKIESSLGTKLFQRTNTGLVLTYTGERYYQIAADIMKIYNDFEIEVSDINNLKKGRITIGITIYLATLLLPPVLLKFKRKYPNIEVFIAEKNSTELEKSLSSGEIDFAIMHTAPFYEISDSSYVDFHSLFKDPFLLATKKDHPLGRNAIKSENSEYPQIDISLFSKEPFIMLNRWQRIRQVSNLILQKANINPIVALTTKSYETARRLACEGIGVTFVPEQYLQISPGVYLPDYYSIDEKYSPYWKLCIAVQKNAYISKAAKMFIKMTCEHFGAKVLDLCQRDL